MCLGLRQQLPNGLSNGVPALLCLRFSVEVNLTSLYVTLIMLREGGQAERSLVWSWTGSACIWGQEEDHTEHAWKNRPDHMCLLLTWGFLLAYGIDNSVNFVFCCFFFCHMHGTLSTVSRMGRHTDSCLFSLYRWAFHTCGLAWLDLRSATSSQHTRTGLMLCWWCGGE